MFLNSLFGNLTAAVTATFPTCHCNGPTLFLWSVPAALAYCRVELVYSLHVSVCLSSILLLTGTTQERSEIVLVSLSVAHSIFVSFVPLCYFLRLRSCLYNGKQRLAHSAPHCKMCTGCTDISISIRKISKQAEYSESPHLHCAANNKCVPVCQCDNLLFSK